jgi:predicted transcriptional regulator of viral defense system
MEMRMSQVALIERRVSKAEPGTVFIAADFSDLGSRDNVNQVLSRLARRGDIIRAVRGVYGKPRWSKYLQVWINPSPNRVAHAIARMNGWVISPSADVALNELGLDTQVPARYDYVSTGPSKSYEYGVQRIHMTHHSGKDLIGFSPLSMLLNLALREIGHKKATPELARQLSKRLASEDIDTYVNETRNGTLWMHEFAKSMREAK